MELRREVHLKSRVSLVVGLSDSFTSEAPIGTNIAVHLEGARSIAISKSTGSYIFNDLPEGDYRLRIDAEHYFQEQIPFSTRSSRSIEQIRLQLQPLPSYPFPPGAPLIRVCLRDGKDAPLQGAPVAASVLTEECARARLMPEQTGAGAEEIAVGFVTGSMVEGSRYVLRERGPQGPEEPVQIAEVLEHRKRFRLAKPLVRSYSRGALLLPAVETRCTERGEAVIALGGCRAPSFSVRLHVAGGGSGQPFLKEVMVAEGQTTNLGTQYIT